MREGDAWLFIGIGLLGWLLLEMARELDDQAEDIQLLAENPELYRAKHNIRGRRGKVEKT